MGLQKNFGIKSLIFWGHVTSSVTWPFDSAYVVSYWQSIEVMHLSCTVMEIWGPKDIGVTTLTFWGLREVIGHVTIGLGVSTFYWWSMMTRRLTCTGTEIRGFKNFGVTSFTFWGHVTPSVSAYVVSYWWSSIYLAPLRRYWAPNIMGSWPWPFGVTLRHQPCDHSTPDSRLPMNGPLLACVYLAPLQRYGISKIMRSQTWPFGVIRLLGVDFLWVVHSDHVSI